MLRVAKKRKTFLFILREKQEGMERICYFTMASTLTLFDWTENYIAPKYIANGREKKTTQCWKGTFAMAIDPQMRQLHTL